MFSNSKIEGRVMITRATQAHLHERPFFLTIEAGHMRVEVAMTSEEFANMLMGTSTRVNVEVVNERMMHAVTDVGSIVVPPLWPDRGESTPGSVRQHVRDAVGNHVTVHTSDYGNRHRAAPGGGYQVRYAAWFDAAGQPLDVSQPAAEVSNGG